MNQPPIDDGECWDPTEEDDGMDAFYFLGYLFIGVVVFGIVAMSYMFISNAP